MKTAILSSVSLATLAAAQGLVTYCIPENNGVCYSFNTPQASAGAVQSDIFMQITAPSTMSWVGLAQAPEGLMAGSNMFVLYSNQNGSGITLSPRLGLGHMMPKYDGDTQYTLLDGSGISNGTMTANIHCSNCASWQGGSMSMTDPSSTWIYAYKVGSPTSSSPSSTSSSSSSSGTPPNIRSNSQAAPISFHDGYGSFQINLTAGIGGSGSSNPFTGLSLNSTTSSATKGLSHTDPETMAMLSRARVAHASVLGLAFGLVYPAGALLMRLHGRSYTWAVHGSIQALGLCLSTAGLGLGIHLACTYDALGSPHAVLGLLVTCGVFFMPVLGWVQHTRFCKFHRRTFWGRGHAYAGRVLLLAAMVNVGLGLRLVKQLAGQHAGDSIREGEIAYGVLVGLVGICWLGLTGWTALKRRRARMADQGDEGMAEIVGAGGSDAEKKAGLVQIGTTGSRSDMSEKGKKSEKGPE